MMIESGTSQCPRLYNVILAEHREIGPQFQQAMEVGDGTQKLTESQISIMCKLAGPNIEKLEPQFQQAMEVGDEHREFRKEILQAMEVGVNEFNFVKISFLSHSLCMNLIMYSYF